MAISFDKVFGNHIIALKLRAERAEILANNIVNAETPGFLARDLDFKAVLNSYQKQSDNAMLPMQGSHDSHLELNPLHDLARIKYRVPMQPAADRNSVDSQYEYSQFSQNALQYQSSLRFLSGKVSGIMTAIRGE